MSGGARSQKQERARLVRALRGSGSSWVEIAAALRRSYQVNPRVAFRYARGWSQDEAAEEWNRRWPDELKTFKNFSHWESWPGPTGHAPTYGNLSKLAELYECSVSDLLADLPNFRHLDTAGPTKTTASKECYWKLLLLTSAWRRGNALSPCFDVVTTAISRKGEGIAAQVYHRAGGRGA